jgi:hypothetical protein
MIYGICAIAFNVVMSYDCMPYMSQVLVLVDRTPYHTIFLARNILNTRHWCETQIKSTERFFVLFLSQAILPCIHLDGEIIAVMVLAKGINKF